MRPGIWAVLTAAVLGSVFVPGEGVRAQSATVQAPTTGASVAPSGLPTSTARPGTTAAKRKDTVGASAKQAAKASGRDVATGTHAVPAVPISRTSSKAGEVDSVNLPGVRESGRRKLGATPVTQPASMPSLGAGMPTIGNSPSRSADTDSAGRKYPGGGVMTGDVSIGGPLGAGPYGR